MTKKTSGKGTMLMSVLMSAPGPLVVGLGLLAGRSATQLADFIRRSAELLALIVAYLTFRRTATLEAQAPQKAEMERRSNLFVGLAMCLSGGAMLLIALLGQETEQGNVIPGLCIAVLGVIANTIFWLRYRRLSRTQDNAILAVQSRLYRAKSLVDLCVTTALCVVLVWPGSAAAAYFDRIGSVVVSCYLLQCGARTVKENRQR